MYEAGCWSCALVGLAAGIMAADDAQPDMARGLFSRAGTFLAHTWLVGAVSVVWPVALPLYAIYKTCSLSPPSAELAATASARGCRAANGITVSASSTGNAVASADNCVVNSGSLLLTAVGPGNAYASADGARVQGNLTITAGDASSLGAMASACNTRAGGIVTTVAFSRSGQACAEAAITA